MSKEKKSIGDYVIPFAFATSSGAALVNGISSVCDYSSIADNIRNHVFSHAEKINPEVMETATELVNEATKGYMTLTIFHFAVATATAAAAYYGIQKLLQK